MRAGSQALSLLAVPLNVHVLRALEGEGRTLADLRRTVGFPPQTTLRNHLRVMTELGVLRRDQRDRFPGSVDYELGPGGVALLEIAETVDGWLARRPAEACVVGTPAGKGVIKAFVDGWSSTLVRALAARPLSLTELSRLITAINYPSLERRMAAMRQVGLLEPSPIRGRSTPYAVTHFLRQAMAPLVAAVRWERDHLGAQAPPMARIDVEAAFLLAVPAVQLGEEANGTCRLAMELGAPSARKLAGVVVEIRDGSVSSCVTRLSSQADGWASGSPHAWFQALTGADPDVAGLEAGGKVELATPIVRALRQGLFAPDHR